MQLTEHEKQLNRRTYKFFTKDNKNKFKKEEERIKGELNIDNGHVS